MAVVGSACVALVVLPGCGSGSGLGGKTPAEVLVTAVTAAEGSGSCHFVDKNGSGTEARLLVGDTGTVDAQQSLSAAGASFDVRLVDGVAYLRGPTDTLESLLGLSAAEASAETGKWLSVTKKDKGYRQISQSLKVEAELDGYIPQAPLAFGSSTTLHGIPVIAVSGSAPAESSTGALNAKATLFVSTEAPYLPVGGVLSGADVHGRPVHEEVAFTGFGEHVRVAVPPGAVAVASLV